MLKKNGLKSLKKARKEKNPVDIARKLHLTALSKRLKKYSKLNYFEQFAMYMGVAQLFELRLKNILIIKHGYEEEKLKMRTLGQIIYEFERKNLYISLIPFLKEIVEDRNYIAHNLLASDILFHYTIKKPIGTNTKRQKILIKACIELEQAVMFFENIDKD